MVILTTSGAEQDILKTYQLHANCYIKKPVDLDQFMRRHQVHRGILVHDRETATGIGVRHVI